MANTTKSELATLFRTQRSAFLANMYPSFEERMGWLKTLEQMMLDCREATHAALNQDFGSHPPRIADLFENGCVISRSRYAQTQLKQWMTPDVRPLNTLAHGSSTVEVIRIPKGVMGVIGPWNFPVECSLGMVVDMFAAGNRVIVKPSELAPATAEMLRKAVRKYFPADVLSVVTGGADFAAQFSELPWDHLTFTGGTRVGRLVAQAAAKNLTPVTLELGGKNPTVFMEDGVTDQFIKEFLSFKFVKSGQVCTSPDYAFVPAGMLDQWIQTAKTVWGKAYPKYIGHPDVTGMLNEHHYDRVLDLIDEAKDRGVRVIPLSDEAPDRARRHIPMHLVVNPNEQLGVMKEEIFGPVIALLPYTSLDDVWAYINAHPRPLASYLVTRDQRIVDVFRTAIISGGAAVNVFGFQAAEPGAPFGGSGASGIGCHMGVEGFLGYSHSKTVFHCSDDNPLKASLVAPYGEIIDHVAAALYG